ncbi:hypothetical protein [Colwellia psychrerythraea]|uniref:Outer membrane protein beta-barrel domain-containing protein n=1 Tax=Colwellia psychrerythraea TaxID=28229 RepID=A0A099L1R5_COLPS|nr:hypothetical protein [Colwellia psychrerythraea]KGJ96390.1 hypothetical protein GAB14E_0337 [Colwellia psychrerythraea]
MKKFISTSIAGFLLASSMNVQAEGPVLSEDFKQVTLGVGVYSLVIADDNNYYQDDELSGFGISAMYSFNDSFAVRGQYYSLEHDSFSAIEDKGFDIVAYFGTGLATTGFKAYIGGGVFNENWKTTGFKQGFSGLQLNGGVGYSWDVIALDLVLGIREAGDYKSFSADQGITIDPSAVSSSLIISARF